MSLRSSSSRLISAIPRSSRARAFATSSPVCYPRMTNNRFAPPSEISSSSDDFSGSTSSAPSTTPSASSSSIPRTPKVSLPDQNFVDADYDAATALASARQRAWYLEEEEEVASKPKPKDAPNFVTFDPERTTTSRGSSRIKPLPTDAPAELVVLHQWLTSREAAYVLDTSSVVFLNTRTAGKHMTGEGEVIKVEGVDIAAPVWNWVVVAVVKGRGKGVVGRAERALRVWLHKNPIGPVEGRVGGKKSKLPRVPEETDWSMVQVPQLHTCVNLFTVEGQERWNLEGMWGKEGEGGEEKPKRGFGFPKVTVGRW